MNLAILTGRVGADPEIRAQRDGSRSAVLRLATSKRWKDKSTGERKEKTEWHQVVIWNDAIAGVVEQWVRKGSQISVTGEIQTRKYQDRDGNDRYTTEIVLQGWNGSLELLGGAKGTDDADAKSDVASSGVYADLDDTVPF